MAVYPFYTKVESSTRNTPVGVGARSKDGVLNTFIHQRDRGQITVPITINQYTYTTEMGVLMCRTKIFFQGELLKEYDTEY